MRLVLIASLSISIVACEARPAPTVMPEPPNPTVAATDPREPMSVPGSKNLAGLANLIPMLQGEAANRPSVKVTPEKLFDALTSAGLEVKQRKQVLAKSVDGRFCALGKLESTSGVIGVVVCEFDSAVDAETSRNLQERELEITNVARVAVGPTLVTVTNVAENRDTQRRIFEVFRSL